MNLYRPHLAFGNAVEIKGSSIEDTSTFPKIVVRVIALTNPKTPAYRDPVTIKDRFVCRLNPGNSSIDHAATQNCLRDHKNGIKL